MVYLCQPKGVFILIKYWEDFDMIEYFKGVKKKYLELDGQVKKNLLNTLYQQ